MKIVLLTSAMGLGTYVPALHLYEYLKSRGHKVSMEVFERYFSDDTMGKYLKNKQEYHKSFKVAKLGHKLAEKRLGTVLDEETEKKILESWKQSGVERFILLSGNWVSTVKKYGSYYEEKIKAAVVHMDVAAPPSWKHFDNSDQFFQEILPFDAAGVHYLFETPFTQKTDEKTGSSACFFFHGGGWGMGNYHAKKMELEKDTDSTFIELVYNETEMEEDIRTNYYLMDQNWKPWLPQESGAFSFPVMLDGKSGVKLDNQNMRGLYEIYADCNAIISKPGGGTILDSMITGTPIVFLEPVASHEKKNQEAWEALGMGISFEKWKETGYSLNTLQKIRQNIQENCAGKKGLGAHLEEVLK